MATFKDLLKYVETIPACVGSNKNVNILFREKEKEFILNFFGPRNSIPYPCLFIYGHTATGKTILISETLKDLPHVWVNCHESNSSKFIFKSIVYQLCNDAEYLNKSYNSCEFINTVKKLLINRNETTYIVFDAAEVLRKENSVLSTLIRLQDLTKVNVCTILISELPWIKFSNVMVSFNPVTLYFPNYTKEQICEILSEDRPKEHSKLFYENYISVILKTFFTVTRNLRELRHQAHINFERYCEPLTEDPDTEISNLRLWRNIEPTLKEALGSVYLREISGFKWKNHCKTNDEENTDLKKTSISTVKYSLTRELPFYSKFLLLAAYFASYNQPKTDFRHFVKNQGKQKKKRITKKMEKNRHLLGPKPFTLDRMLSIFFSIVEERVLPSAMIFSQISSLVSMRLMSRVSLDDQLDCPKYKCIAELDLIEKIGKTVNVDVMGYLDDFL